MQLSVTADHNGHHQIELTWLEVMASRLNCTPKIILHKHDPGKYTELGLKQRLEVAAALTSFHLHVEGAPLLHQAAQPVDGIAVHGLGDVLRVGVHEHAQRGQHVLARQTALRPRQQLHQVLQRRLGRRLVHQSCGAHQVVRQRSADESADDQQGDLAEGGELEALAHLGHEALLQDQRDDRGVVLAERDERVADVLDDVLVLHREKMRQSRKNSQCAAHGRLDEVGEAEDHVPVLVHAQSRTQPATNATMDINMTTLLPAASTVCANLAKLPRVKATWRMVDSEGKSGMSNCRTSCRCCCCGGPFSMENTVW